MTLMRFITTALAIIQAVQSADEPMPMRVISMQRPQLKTVLVTTLLVKVAQMNLQTTTTIQHQWMMARAYSRAVPSRMLATMTQQPTYSMDLANTPHVQVAQTRLHALMIPQLPFQMLVNAITQKNFITVLVNV
jgi:mannose/fructose/N-acetylgalactosamine-specific phosphotransferase system component IIC